MRARTTTGTVLAAAAAGVAAAAVVRSLNNRQPRHGDSAPGRTARRMSFGGYKVQGRTVTIDAPRSEIYRLWQDPRNLPRFMENIQSVEDMGDGRTAWIVRTPRGTARIVVQLVTEKADEVLAWRSTEGSDIDLEAKVQLRDAPGDRGTEVEAHIAYRPPYGELGHWVAKAFRSDPAAQGRHELKRLKMLLETGEIATAANRRES
jgi:uncharacterized membrane protein